MKRIAIFVLPMLATVFAVGIGLFLWRTQGSALGTRLRGARETVPGTVAETLDEATQAIEKALA